MAGHRPHRGRDRPHRTGRDTYRPSRPGASPFSPHGSSSSMFQFHGKAGDDGNFHHRGDHRDGQNREFTFRATKIYERPLLRGQGDKPEERLLSNPSAPSRFRDLANLTDSDEAEMEDSSDDEDSEGAYRPTKRVKVKDVEVEDKPKWSNPDPYTALPAPNESTGKRLDFVKLIRKARNDVGKDQKALDAASTDFISLDLDDAFGPPSHAPTGPQALNGDIPTRDDARIGALGKRKRGEETGKLISKRKKGTRYLSNGMVLDEWRSAPGLMGSPWLQPCECTSAGIALHREVLDFYEWVRPRDYEAAVRAEALSRIESCLKRLESGNLKPFGSYAAGLYLPIGDMDVVYLLRNFRPSRPGATSLPFPMNKHRLLNWTRHIERSSLAKPGSVIPITGAKVPIIKFVERISGLRIDLSFNNDTGVVAIETFQRWKKDYPAMPILVSIVKQFLMIRGLNDVSVGGLGGFSVICLVTSLIQHMPMRNSRSNLGEMLLEFFNLYGHNFNRNDIAIRMEPPAYIDKDTYKPHLYNREKPGRLTIIDPNQPTNNISGGTSEIELIFRCFAQASDTLQGKLQEFGEQSGRSFSFLADLIGGDFQAYEIQRSLLRQLHTGPDGMIAPSIDIPPPPPIDHRTAPPPPPPPPPPPSHQTQAHMHGPQNENENAVDLHVGVDDDETSSSGTGGSQNLKPAQKRALLMKKLRPELADQIGSRLNTPSALKIGGYRSAREMQVDLRRREKQITGSK